MAKFDIDEFYIDDLLDLHSKKSKGDDKGSGKKKDKKDKDKKAKKKSGKKKDKKKHEPDVDPKLMKKLAKKRDRDDGYDSHPAIRYGLRRPHESIIIMPPLTQRWVDGVMVID